jgi:hypothetical protein
VASLSLAVLSAVGLAAMASGPDSLPFHYWCALCVLLTPAAAFLLAIGAMVRIDQPGVRLRGAIYAIFGLAASLVAALVVLESGSDSPLFIACILCGMLMPPAACLLGIVAVVQIYRPGSRLRGAAYAILGVAVGSVAAAIVLWHLLRFCLSE